MGKIGWMGIGLLFISGGLSGCKDGEVKGKGYLAMLEGPSSGGVAAEPAPTKTIAPLPSPSPSPSPGPAGNVGTLDAGCMTNANYDSCLVLKNPVSQRRAALSPALTPTSNLDSVLTYGVKFVGLDNSGFLQNSSIRVVPGGTRARVKANANGSWKYPFSTACAGATCTADANHNVGQLMAYYWLEFQATHMTTSTGKFYAKDKNITVTTFRENLNNAYWDGNGNIVMGDGGSSKAEFAMSAEIYLHEMGHANLTYAAPGTSGGLGNCATAKGCIGGIHEGQADYHAAIVFPQNGVPVGEVIVNSINGFSECGITRTVGGNKNTTAQQAYDACTSQKGEVHLMGRIYASVWWEVRSKTTSVASEVDSLFTEHLKGLQASDTFETALGKIKATDQALFNSKYSKDFTDEFARRGI